MRSPLTSVENHHVLEQMRSTLKSKANDLLAHFKLQLKTAQPKEKVLFQTIINKLSGFLKIADLLPDSDIFALSDSIIENKSTLQDGDKNNQAKGLFNTLKGIDAKKLKLLNDIRELFPTSAGEFGFRTDNTITIQSLGEVGDGRIERFRLVEEYFVNLLVLVEDLGYELEKIESFTGSYDETTVRVNPFTFLNLPDHGVIIAESFVYANAIFVFDINKVRSSLGIALENSFIDIAKELNLLLKKESTSIDGGTRIVHHKGYLGTIKATISKIKDDFENPNGLSEEEEYTQIEKKGSKEWINRFEAYATNPSNLIDGKLIQPSNTHKNPEIKSLGTKLKRIKDGENYFTTHQLQKLKTLGFITEVQIEKRSPELWMLDFQAYSTNPVYTTDGQLIQPSHESKNKFIRSLAGKLNAVRQGEDVFSPEQLNQLIGLGFNIERQRSQKTPAQKISELKAYAMDPLNTIDGVLIQPNTNHSDSNIRSLANTIRDLKQGKEIFSLDQLQQLIELGFIIEKQVEKRSSDLWMPNFEVYAKDSTNQRNGVLIQPSSSSLNESTKKLAIKINAIRQRGDGFSTEQLSKLKTWGFNI